MTPEKKIQIVRTPSESRRAKQELERQKMTMMANNRFLPDKPATSDAKSLSAGEMRILIGGLNRIAAEIQNISLLLSRSVDES